MKIKALVRPLLLAGGLAASCSASALNLGDVLNVVAAGETSRMGARTDCQAVPAGTVPGQAGGSATIAIYPCTMSAGQDGAMTLVADITFNDYSTVPGVSSKGTVQVSVTTAMDQTGSGSFTYKLNSPGGAPTVFTIAGEGSHSVVFQDYTVSATVANGHPTSMSFSGGATVDGQYWAAGADNWGYVWGG